MLNKPTACFTSSYSGCLPRIIVYSAFRPEINHIRDHLDTNRDPKFPLAFIALAHSVTQAYLTSDVEQMSRPVFEKSQIQQTRLRASRVEGLTTSGGRFKHTCNSSFCGNSSVNI